MPSAFVNGDTIASVTLDSSGSFLYVTKSGILRNNNIVVRAEAPSNAFIQTQIINHGEILSGLVGDPDAFPAIIIDDGVCDITNHGSIVSSGGTAIKVLAGARLYNYGSVTGNIKFDRSDYSSRVLNHGTITGGLSADADSFITLENHGFISGNSNIAGGSLGDYVVNAGTIATQVTLGNGHDLYDGSLGLLTAALYGEAGDDTLLGGRGAEYIDGGIGDDEIAGGAGNDVILGGTGFDNLDGGDGFDLVSYALAVNAVLVDLTDDGLNTGDAADDVLSGFEGVIGSALADTLIGAAGANELRGGAGNDSLDGAAGADTLRGGTGADVMRVDNARDLIIETASAGADTVIASISYRLAPGAEVEVLATSNAAGAGALNLTGSNTSNAITGNAGTNRLLGLSGADTISGLGGLDTLDGGQGADSLMGGAGNDLLLGGNGNDSLVGGTEADTLIGGAGTNHLTGGSGNDIFLLAVDGSVRILDFTPGADKIHLPKALVPGLATGAVPDAAFAIGLNGRSEQNRLFISFNPMAPNDRTLNYDPDGGGSELPVLIAYFPTASGLSFSASDFTVVA